MPRRAYPSDVSDGEWALLAPLLPVAGGFQVLPRRWVVERTLGWLGRWRRTSKDDEYLPHTSACVIYAVMIRVMLRRLAACEA